MKITWREYLKLNEVLEDDDFSLLTLLMLHPELPLRKVAEWCSGMKRRYNSNEEYSIEGIRLRIKKLIYKIEKIRGFQGDFDDFSSKIREYNAFKKELEDEMIDRYCQIYYELGVNSDAIWLTLQEYGYPMSYDNFDLLLRRRLGKNYISDLAKIRDSKIKENKKQRGLVNNS